MCDQTMALAILCDVYNSCSPIFGHLINDAYLYGSYARGDYHEESDVDILLTVNLTPEEISKLRNCIGAISADISLKYDVTVSVTVKPLSQFMQYAEVLPYYKNILREGIRYAS